MRGICLDTGALIGIDRGDRFLLRLLERVTESGLPIAVPAGVLAQAWRDGSRQARLGRVLRADGVTVPALDSVTARAVGEICARSGASDVIDASVALHARAHGQSVVTSDPGDFTQIDPALHLIVV